MVQLMGLVNRCCRARQSRGSLNHSIPSSEGVERHLNLTIPLVGATLQFEQFLDQKSVTRIYNIYNGIFRRHGRGIRQNHLMIHQLLRRSEWRRRIHPLSIFTAALLTCSLAGCGSDVDLAKYLERNLPANFQFVLDIDGDGNDEILGIIRSGGYIHIESLESGRWNTIYIHDTASRIMNVYHADLHPMKDEEIIVHCKYDSGQFFNIYGNIFSTDDTVVLIDSVHFQNGNDIRSPEGWDGYYEFASGYDVNGDGRKDMIMSVTTGRDRYPREVFVYDLYSKSRLWRFKSANTVTVEVVADVLGDSRPEIIISGGAPINVAKEGFDRDDRCRVYIVDIETGSEIQRKEFELYSDNCKVLLFPSNTEQEKHLLIQVTYSHRKAISGASSASEAIGETWFYNWDPILDKLVDSVRTRGIPNEVISYQIGGQSYGSFAVSYVDGILRILDVELNIIRERNFTVPVMLSAVYDINSDGAPEYYLSTQNGQAFILDANLETIAHYTDSTMLGTYMKLTLARLRNTIPTRLYLAASYIGGIEKTAVFFIPELPPHSWLGTFFWLVGVHYETIGLSALFASLLLLISVLERSRRRNRSFYSAITRGRTLGIIHVVGGRVIVANYLAEKYLDFELEELDDANMSLLLDRHGLEELRNLIENPKEALNRRISHTVISVGSEKREYIAIVTVIRGHRDNPREYVVFLMRPEISKSEWLVLASGISHDIKNPCGLASTQLSALGSELLSKDVFNSVDIIKQVEVANANVRRALDRISSFANVVREIHSQKKPVNVNDYLRDYVAVRKLSVPKSVSLDFKPGSAIPDVFLDPSYIEYALDNLLHNAVNALSGKDSGAITISTNSGYFPDAASGGDRLSDCVSIRFQDTGQGISEEDIPHIFDLDFTTNKGSGLGLGLFQVRRIIEEHSGKIEVESFPGEGTTFTIHLPAYHS